MAPRRPAPRRARPARGPKVGRLAAGGSRTIGPRSRNGVSVLAKAKRGKGHGDDKRRSQAGEYLKLEVGDSNSWSRHSKSIAAERRWPRWTALTGDRWFESTSLQQTVRVSPRPGRCRSKNPRFRAGVRRWGRQRRAGVSRDRAKRRCYLCRAIFQYRSDGNVIGQRRAATWPKLVLRSISQAKRSRTCCSCQASGRREWASSLSAVKSGG